MTEAEWLICGDPKPMLLLVRDKISNRKLRLFACALCRQIWSMLDSIGKQAVEIAEWYADGGAGAEVLAQMENLAWWGADDLNYETDSVWNAGWAAHSATSDTPIETMAFVTEAVQDKTELPKFCQILRDIVGNPFQLGHIDSRWLTSTVSDLASSLYAEKDFDRMSILADALMDAGCDSEEILNHCRAREPHARGCWVLDLLTGRE
jgi:hypothetical protein